MVVPDYGKSLHQLRQEWETCTACDLGAYRQHVGGDFVFGEGLPDRIMLIGKGPGKDEEKEGRPFIGGSGQLLRRALNDLNMMDMVYLTNCVACRSCAQAYNGEGQPVTMNNGKPRIIDQPPSPQQVQSCSARLYEEVYIVDPVLIVALGGTAAEMLLRKPISIQSECGSTKLVRIPGGGWVPQLTEKKQQWRHKVRKEWVSPVMQNQVEYLCVPCLHPDFVARNIEDKRKGSPLEQFMSALQLARDVYNKYVNEVSPTQVA